jgi:outer membrane protein OmpA-like peptidoglycan-associated protein
VPLLSAVLAVAGCAKKSFVVREVSEVNRRVDAVSADLERTQQRVQQNEVRIEAVDKSARGGIGEAKGAAAAAMTRAQEAERAARGKLIYAVKLSDDHVRFAFDRAEISDEGKVAIDGTVAPLVQANSGVYLEIEGHTDSVGDTRYNQKLGERRATVVRDYIAKTQSVALSRLSVISYGEEKPVTGNKTREERAENRRVVIRVLE